MRVLLMSLLSGILFGLGLAISEMVNPLRVIGFLDVTGEWDPTLGFVMGSALMLTMPIFHYVLKRKKPVFVENFSLPDKKYIDKKLLIGSSLFGLGWGLAGLCPGPAIAALVTLTPDVIIFVSAMLCGFWLEKYIERIAFD